MKISLQDLVVIDKQIDMQTSLQVFVVIDAFAEFSGKELDAHNWEDKPEDQANQDHVADTGNGVHQRVYHDLRKNIRTI